MFVLGKSGLAPEVPAFYDPAGRRAYIFLATIKELCRNEDRIINYVVNTIIHEALHHAIRECLGPADPDRVKKEHWVMKVIGLEEITDA